MDAGLRIAIPLRWRTQLDVAQGEDVEAPGHQPVRLGEIWLRVDAGDGRQPCRWGGRESRRWYWGVMAAVTEFQADTDGALHAMHHLGHRHAAQAVQAPA